MIKIPSDLRKVLDALSGELTWTDVLEFVRDEEAYADVHFPYGNPDYFEADDSFEIAGMEFRVIHENYINEVHDTEVIESIKECYFQHIKDLPPIVSNNIDWDRMAEEVRHLDGYAHHFANYDGVDYYDGTNYIFRTN